MCKTVFAMCETVLAQIRGALLFAQIFLTQIFGAQIFLRRFGA